jgi:hypothetical protein
MGCDRRNAAKRGKTKAVKEGEIHYLIPFIRYLESSHTILVN